MTTVGEGRTLVSHSLENNLYFCARTKGEGHPTIWFVINFPMDDHKKKNKKKQRKSKEDDDDGEIAIEMEPFSVAQITPFGTLVTKGSTIYSLGGRIYMPCGWLYRPSHDVYRYSTSYPEAGWIRCPSMKTARSDSRATVLDGKIYVFGGTKNTPWAEVFDPSLGKWEDLPPPDEDLVHDLCVNCTVVAGSKRILVVSSRLRELHIYNAGTKSWQLYYARQRFPGCEFIAERPLVVGDTIYWYSDKFHAFDLVNRIRYSGHIQGLKLEDRWDPHGNLTNIAHLLHLKGKMFCLIWLEGHNCNVQFKRVHCTKIRASKGRDRVHNPIVRASVVHSQSYLVDDRTMDLCGLLLNVRLEASSWIGEIIMESATRRSKKWWAKLVC